MPTTETLNASAQYDDWKGTAAADNAAEGSVHELLRDRGLFDHDKESVLSIEMWMGENYPQVYANIIDIAGMDNVPAWLAQQKGAIPVKHVKLDLSADQFLRMFKISHVVLTPRGLGDLSGREYQYEEEV